MARLSLLYRVPRGINRYHRSKPVVRVPLGGNFSSSSRKHLSNQPLASQFDSRHPVASAAPHRLRPDHRNCCHSPKDRKSTRLNSSHLVISYAVFCLKKKKSTNHIIALQAHSRSPTPTTYTLTTVLGTCNS